MDRKVILETLGVPEEAFDVPMEMESSIYDNFKLNLYNSGTILWRENSKDIEVIVMNDYDSETGAFKVRLL